MMPAVVGSMRSCRSIWKHFIPEDDRHVFERGLYFAKEVIPDYLAVISLNTLYWFASNSSASGRLPRPRRR